METRSWMNPMSEIQPTIFRSTTPCPLYWLDDITGIYLFNCYNNNNISLRPFDGVNSTDATSITTSTKPTCTFTQSIYISLSVLLVCQLVATPPHTPAAIRTSPLSLSCFLAANQPPHALRRQQNVTYLCWSRTIGFSSAHVGAQSSVYIFLTKIHRSICLLNRVIPDEPNAINCTSLL